MNSHFQLTRFNWHREGRQFTAKMWKQALPYIFNRIKTNTGNYLSMPLVPWTISNRGSGGDTSDTAAASTDLITGTSFNATWRLVFKRAGMNIWMDFHQVTECSLILNSIVCHWETAGSCARINTRRPLMCQSLAGLCSRGLDESCEGAAGLLSITYWSRLQQIASNWAS